MIRHDTTRCDAMRCDAMRCDAMRCDAMRYNTDIFRDCVRFYESTQFHHKRRLNRWPLVFLSNVAVYFSGRHKYYERVAKFKVKYSNDRRNWSDYTESNKVRVRSFDCKSDISALIV